MRTALTSACERALIDSARARRDGTRQQLRAAARRFVRRHRRDVGYLRWVLRSVGASSALAVALLGLAAEPAHAKATLFTLAGPIQGLDVGNASAPALGDLDGDGDLDLVAGELGGSFAWFENTGSAASPAFAARTGVENPLDGHDVGFRPAVALGDLDGDGDLDLVAGASSGAFAWFENTGSATGPAFALRTGAQNPLDGQDAGTYSAPALGDLDGDGDLDLVSGADDSDTFAWFENTGSATSPAFSRRTGTQNPLDDQGYTLWPAPSLGDVDRDGDLDLVAGDYYGSLRFVENTGSATSPAFVTRTGGQSPVEPVPALYYTKPALGDLDADGDVDLVSGDVLGGFVHLANRAGTLVSRSGLDNPLSNISVAEQASAPALGDLDADGDLDLVSGTYFYGLLRYFENTGGAASPAFAPRTGAQNPFDGLSPGDFSAPALGDLDGDGDLDLAAGEQDGTFHYFENTGSAASPAFVERTGSANPLDGQDVGLRSMPSLGDVDGDGDLDLFAGKEDGTLVYFENTGSAASPAFVLRTGPQNPLDGHVFVSQPAPSLADLDGDGDLDLVADAYSHSVYFENIGSPATPAFVPRTGPQNPLPQQIMFMVRALTPGDLDADGDLDLVGGVYSGNFVFFENAIVKSSGSIVELPGGANPLDGLDAGSYAAPALGDLDADGDLDLVSGENLGAFLYFENTGNATSPRFAARTGSANPLDGLSVGALYSAPALGDLDADGDLDLVAGEYDGTFHYFENTGSATSPAFVARTGAQNPLDGQDAGSPRSAPSIGDLDGDGDLDLVAGSYSGAFRYLENTGSAASPAFVARTGAQNPLDGQDVGNTSTPVLGDVDGDGDLDLFAGNYIGTIDYFENTGSATSPALVARPELYVPLDDYVWTPALGDLDADGDLDVVAGDVGGDFRTFYLPEPAQGLMLGAGLALLSWLERLRGRRAPA